MNPWAVLFLLFIGRERINMAVSYSSSVEFKVIHNYALINYFFYPICALYPVWEVSPTLPLKQFYCSFDWRWPFFVFWRKIVSRALVLSTPLNSRRFSASCPQVVCQDPPHFFKTRINCYSCFSSQSLLCHSPSLHRAQGSTNTGVCEGGCWTLTHASLNFPFHFSIFETRSLTLRGWWHVCHPMRQYSGGHVSLSPLPLSSWRLRPYSLHCLYG